MPKTNKKSTRVPVYTNTACKGTQGIPSSITAGESFSADGVTLKSPETNKQRSHDAVMINKGNVSAHFLDLR